MSQYAPPETVPGQLLKEKGWLQGAIVGGVAYGTCIILFLSCFPLLVESNWSSRTRTRFSVILLTYTALIFVLTTFFMGSLARFTEMAFIENRNFPGGPSAYEEQMFSVPASELGNVSFVVANWLSDAMIVSRAECLTLLGLTPLPGLAMSSNISRLPVSLVARCPDSRTPLCWFMWWVAFSKLCHMFHSLNHPS
jgi:hypothetical protein